MSYKTHKEVMEDIKYGNRMDPDNMDIHFRYDFEQPRVLRERNNIRIVCSVWTDHIKEKYEHTSESNTILGRFLKKYPLPFKEFLCLTDLLDEDPFSFRFSRRDRDEGETDKFAKYRIRYESSQLKRFKLVFRIINPKEPMKKNYQVSYAAQLALQGKKYTEEYEQMDMALEEESKRSSPDELEGLYYAIHPKTGLKNLVADNTLIDNLQTAIMRERSREKIFKGWGFGKVIEYGRGTTINFRGPPGTGKTLAAHCMAKELGKKLLMVRYDQLQNLYVGETEKHITQVFKLAKVKNAVLFFDEADAIALSRHFLESSWEMSQVNTLLKELERFEGVCIFATNFAQKYDPAFERRLTMHIDFRLPDKEQALKILDKVFPRKSREKGLKLDSINVEGLSGGDLKNVALNAAGVAAKDKAKKISLEHINEAVSIVKAAKANAEAAGLEKRPRYFG